MIFISYRVDDSKEVVEHLDTRLAAEFGRAVVFRDKKRLAGGDQWPDVLERQAKTCKVVLVVIGAKWQTAAYTDDARLGQLRLHDTADWVRKEITLALDHGATVIPVLLNGQKTPNRTWLDGCGLGRLADCQGVKLRTDEYDADFATLAETVRKCLPASPAPPPPPPSPPPPPRVWRTEVQYALQPAPHFAGRVELLKELSTWAVAPNDPVRVRALVAAGGTGKTAVAERVLAKLPDENPFGVFVWSFYENPQTEAFLRAACEYFLGEAPKDTGGLLEHLQRGLRAADLPHLLILDGLELVQATGTTGRPRGELEDPLMKRFLRWLAAGRGTRAKALITSRFPLPDLADWSEGGFLSCDLDDLDAEAARVVFRKRGVKGTDGELDALTGSVHGHALTVDVLGLYLQRFGNSDPKHADKFDLTAFGPHQKAERLSKVLASYAANLPNEERDLLARLSLFPRGVTVEWLTVVIAEGGEIAGALVGRNQMQIINMLEGLREIGLVFVSDSHNGRTFSAHPFLRDFFRGLMGTTKPELVHEAVRKQIAGSLDERPEKNPTEPTLLDRYERLIEITLLAGDVKQAFDLYDVALGSYRHLGWALGEYERGRRIVYGFFPNGDMRKTMTELTPEATALVLSDLGLYHRDLGDLNTAHEAFTLEANRRENVGGINKLSHAYQCISTIEMLGGKWSDARDTCVTAISIAERSGSEEELLYCHARLGGAYYGLGDLRMARQHFDTILPFDPNDDRYKRAPQLSSVFGLRYIPFLLSTGRRDDAEKLCHELSAFALKQEWKHTVALYNTFLAHCTRANPSLAANFLERARPFSHTGDVDIILRCHRAAAILASDGRDYHRAFAEVSDGIAQADRVEFWWYSADLRIELAKIHLAADEPAKAIEPAEWVLKRSLEADCQYAWGVADSLHLLGVAYSRLGDKVKAREHLSRAVEKRRPLEHPGLSDTEAELARLG